MTSCVSEKGSEGRCLVEEVGWQGVGRSFLPGTCFCKEEVFLPTLGVRKLLISLALCCMLVKKK